MATYEFRYFIASSDEPVRKRLRLPSDGQARAYAAAELLLRPGHRGVDVFTCGRLVYTHRRWP